MLTSYPSENIIKVTHAEELGNPHQANIQHNLVSPKLHPGRG